MNKLISTSKQMTDNNTQNKFIDKNKIETIIL